jgi:hypothetical protein
MKNLLLLSQIGKDLIPLVDLCFLLSVIFYQILTSVGIYLSTNSPPDNRKISRCNDLNLLIKKFKK